MLVVPLNVPLHDFRKYRRLWTNRNPDEIRLLIRQVDNIGCVVLFFDRYTIMWTLLYKSSCF